MENTVTNLFNNVQIETSETIPSLVQLGKIDSDVKEMVRLIAQFNLREQAVSLLSNKIKKPGHN